MFNGSVPTQLVGLRLVGINFEYSFPQPAVQRQFHVRFNETFFVGLGDNPRQMKAESYNQGICPSNTVLAIFDQRPSNLSGIVCIPDVVYISGVNILSIPCNKFQMSH